MIGERQFGFAIHADSEVAYVDFRADYEALRYEPIEVPPHVGEGITRFMAEMGLVYGALDFVVGPDETFTFLEANPGGQFGFLEAHTGAPLTGTLAGLLARGATR